MAKNNPGGSSLPSTVYAFWYDFNRLYSLSCWCSSLFLTKTDPNLTKWKKKLKLSQNHPPNILKASWKNSPASTKSIRKANKFYMNPTSSQMKRIQTCVKAYNMCTTCMKLYETCKHMSKISYWFFIIWVSSPKHPDSLKKSPNLPNIQLNYGRDSWLLASV